MAKMITLECRTILTIGQAAVVAAGMLWPPAVQGADTFGHLQEFFKDLRPATEQLGREIRNAEHRFHENHRERLMREHREKAADHQERAQKMESAASHSRAGERAKEGSGGSRGGDSGSRNGGGVREHRGPTDKHG